MSAPVQAHYGIYRTPIYRPAPPLLFRVDEAMARIRSLVTGQPEDDIEFARCLPAVRADDPLREVKARSAVASSLIAVLELVRGGEVTATQAEQDGPILLSEPV